MDRYVWIVTYWNRGLEPTVCAFNDEEAANSYRDWLINEQKVDKAIVDKTPIYKKFIKLGEGEIL